MKRFFLGILFAMATLALSGQARAVINVLDNSSFNQYIGVQNNTDQDITFVRSASVCVSQSPDSFVVGANSSATITVVQKYYDTGLDNCYATHHNITYQDSSNSNNMFRIQQYDNSNQYACLDIKYNIIFWINQAVCPESTGDVFGPTNSSPCPDGTPNCPPSDNGSSAQYFGFVVSMPQDFLITLDNQSENELDCIMSDLNKKTDRNICVYTTPTIGSDKTDITLPGACGNNTYRIADRTNVELICYISGSNFQNDKTWVPVSNGATYTYPAAAKRP